SPARRTSAFPSHRAARPDPRRGIAGLAAREMSTSLKSVGAITLFVEDPQRSKAFYEGVFDLSAIWEDEDSAAFKFDNMIVNLLKLPAARDLIDPGAVATPEPGSRCQLTMWWDGWVAVLHERVSQRE